ncbi:hypothetical protein DM02DRAFT_320139 [Periconia macrospinosa]|uniref:Uncharacterized protein n=1 Tax=Periconia macrospinosa TaxID=97972 RepID=A0A2V1D180_9PLEO|nr:hypothetical protein DM02DRAFT_320139 [Periconia macrospinosa]
MPITTTLPTITRNDSATDDSAANTAVYHTSREQSPSDGLALTILAMCCGASLSAISCAILRYQQDSPKEPLRMQFIKYDEVVVPHQVRSSIFNLLRTHPSHNHAEAVVHSVLGHMFSTASKCFRGNHKIPLESIDLIASQANSIPASTIPSAPATPSRTDPALDSWTAVIAEETGITTTTCVVETRRPVNTGNPSAGVPLDSLLLRHPTKFRACLTINDVLNITIVPPSQSENNMVPPSTICGPGTMLINYAMRYVTCNQLEHDHDGSYGAQGRVDSKIVDRFLSAHDYMGRVPPMEMAMVMFGQHEAQGLIDECLFLGLSEHDTIATITRVTAENMVRQYRRLMAAFCPAHTFDEIFICGPGARNTNILDYLKEVLPEHIVTRPLDDVGIPGDAKDAVCCAQLGLETLLLHASLQDGPLFEDQRHTAPGRVARGRNWAALREQVLRFCEGKKVPPVQRVVIEREANSELGDQ